MILSPSPGHHGARHCLRSFLLLAALTFLGACDEIPSRPATGAPPEAVSQGGSESPEIRAARRDFSTRFGERRVIILKEPHPENVDSEIRYTSRLAANLLMHEAEQAAGWEAKKWAGYVPGETPILTAEEVQEIVARSGRDPNDAPKP